MTMKKNPYIIVLGSIVGLAGLSALYFSVLKKPKADGLGQQKITLGKKRNDSNVGIAINTKSTGSEVVVPNWKDPFDMNYERDVIQYIGKGVVVLDESTAKKLAQQLHEAKGDWFSVDNESTVASVFKQLKDKVQVSNLSKAYWNLKKQDLWKHLDSFLNDSEMKELVTHRVQNLPKYTPA